MKNRLWKVMAAGAATITVPLVAALPAGATPPTGYGFDGTPHIIVGGGSDTTYKMQLLLSELYNEASLAAGCSVSTSVGASLNSCILTGSPETNDLGNWQHDTVAQANPVGSSAGIASMNGFSSGSAVTYPGTANPVPAIAGYTATVGPNADFARSSRGPKTTGGNAVGGNELAVDTFWGFAQDGIEVALFDSSGDPNNRPSQVEGLSTAGNQLFTADDLFHIYNCDYTEWNDIPAMAGIPLSTNGPIVPWSMNTNAGTYASFHDWIKANVTIVIPSGWTMNAQSCVRKLANGATPLENDIKPLVNDPVALSGAAASVDNPANWIWWGSFGVFNGYPFTRKITRAGVAVEAQPAPVKNIKPSTANVLANTYPIGRTVYHVTRNVDADCPQTVVGTCDFSGNPGPVISGTNTDLNVTGPSGGVGGSVREYTRFLCRIATTKHKADPFSGTNNFTEITQRINKAGFQIVPAALRTSGSRCKVTT